MNIIKTKPIYYYINRKFYVRKNQINIFIVNFPLNFILIQLLQNPQKMNHTKI